MLVSVMHVFGQFLYRELLSYSKPILLQVLLACGSQSDLLIA